MQWRKGRVKGEHPSVQWARSTEQLGWGHIDMLMELKASGHPPDTGTCRDLGCDPLNLSSSLRSRFPCSSHSDWGVLAPLSFGYDWFLGFSFVITKETPFSQSVFKNYDHDQDGYISQEEFEKIAASFPFSFCVMDKDRWGFVYGNMWLWTCW